MQQQDLQAYLDRMDEYIRLKREEQRLLELDNGRGLYKPIIDKVRKNKNEIINSLEKRSFLSPYAPKYKLEEKN